MGFLLALVGMYAFVEFLYAVRKSDKNAYKRAGIAFVIFAVGFAIL